MADTTRSLRFVSWNVNGLRAVLKKEPSFTQIFDTLGADIFAVQETKLQEGQVELDLPGYHQYWSYAERKGYSGTAVFTREEPLQVVCKIGSPVADDEGRVCALEFPNLWFVDVYTPNSKNGLARLDERMEWDARYRDFLAELARDKPVVTCGDFNVAHEEIDLARPDDNHENAGFSDAERESFTKLLESGLVDTFRERTQSGRRIQLVELSHARPRAGHWLAHRLFSGFSAAHAQGDRHGHSRQRVWLRPLPHRT